MRQKHSPVSETHSSSPHQTQTPSRRILGQSPRPGHLSTQKTQQQGAFFLHFVTVTVHTICLLMLEMIIQASLNEYHVRNGREYTSSALESL